MKAVLKQTAEQRFVFRERNHAIPDVAWREDTVFPAKTPGTATVIGDGHNGGEIGDRAVRIRMFVAAADNVLLEPTEKSGKPSPSAESNNAESTGKRLRFGRDFLHRMT